MTPSSVSMARATAILRRAGLRPTGRHHRKPDPRTPHARLAVRAGLAASVAAVVAFPVVWVTTPDEVSAAPVSVATIPVDEAERIYLAELEAAGVPIPPDRQQAAVDIAREHVAHGHLVGMRESIRSDFESRIPGLTEEQIDVARVVLEHHFLAITGRKQ